MVKEKGKLFAFVVNPVGLTSRRRQFLRSLFSVLRKKGNRCIVAYTSKRRGGNVLAHDAVKQRADVIVACGGDGTIRDVLNGMYTSSACLGILPMGTSNDYAKHLGIRSLGDAKRSLLGEGERKVDICHVAFGNGGGAPGVVFCSTSGVGFDGSLLKLNSRYGFRVMKKLLGKYSYSLAGLIYAFMYRGDDTTIRFDDVQVRVPLYMINVNFVKSMSGLCVTPHADVANGALDVFLVEQTHLANRLLAFFSYFVSSKKPGIEAISYISRKGKGDNKFKISDVKSVHIESKRPMAIQLNGDYIGTTPATFKILPKQVRVIT